jgi:hypothetical protein
MLTSILLSGLLAAEPTEADWTWLSDHRRAALDYFMPLANVKCVVRYRSYRDLYHDVHERYFCIQDWGASAIVVAPEGTSIQEQLLGMHMAEPDATFEALLPRVKIRRWQPKKAGCPAIAGQLGTLEHLKFRVPDMNMIVIHPIVRSIHVDGSFDAEIVDDAHPLAVWADRTYVLLQECPSAE